MLSNTQRESRDLHLCVLAVWSSSLLLTLSCTLLLAHRRDLDTRSPFHDTLAVRAAATITGHSDAREGVQVGRPSAPTARFVNHHSSQHYCTCLCLTGHAGDWRHGGSVDCCALGCTSSECDHGTEQVDSQESVVVADICPHLMNEFFRFRCVHVSQS